MAFFTVLAINAALFAASYLLREYLEEDPDDDPGDRKRRGSSTVAQEGESLPIVLGRARVRKSNVLIYQHGDRSLREYLQGSVTNHEGQHKVDMQLGVCARPIENVTVEFNTMWVGDTNCFPGTNHFGTGVTYSPAPASNANGLYAQHNKRYQIRKSWLYGGPGKGGGIGDYSLQGGTNGQYVGGGLWCMDGRMDQIEREKPTQYTSTDPNYPPGSSLVVQPATDTQLTTGAHYGGHPAVCTFFLRDFQIGETPSMPGFSWEMTVCPDYSGLTPQSITSTVDGVFGIDANPIAALYMVLTDKIIGLGLDAADIDAVSFNTAATECDQEKNGFSYASNSKTTGKKLVDMILKQVEGILFMDPDSLTLKVELARGNFGVYPYAGLTTYDDSNVVDIVQYKESTEQDVYNQVRVKYESRALDYAERYAVAQNPAIATSTGRVRSIDVSYPGVKKGRLANQIAIRELAFYSTPQLFVTLQVMRSAESLRPGDLIKWVCPEYNITSPGFMVLRIHKISYGTIDDGTIELTCSRDKYANQTTTFADPDDGRWGGAFRPKAVAPGCQVVQEVPPNPVFDPGDFAAPVFGNLLVYAEPVSSGSGGSSGGGGFGSLVGSYVSVNDNQFASTGESNDTTNCGTVGVAYSTAPGPYYDTITGLQVYVENPADTLRVSTESEVREGRALLLVGDEYMSYESYTDLSTRAAFRDSDSAVTATNQTDIIVPVPAGVVDGDLMIAIVNLGPEALGSAPAGWTHITDSPRQQDETIDNYMVVMTRTASSEPANYTWSRGSSHLRKITGVIVAFSDAVVDFTSMGGDKVSDAANTLPAGETMLYINGTATEDVEFVMTAFGHDNEWEDTGTSKIDPTEDFTELHDLFETDAAQLQVQYSSIGAVEGPVDYDINLNLVSTNSTYNYVTVGIKSTAPASNLYRLNNVWRGLFDTEAQDHGVDDPVFFLPITKTARRMTQKSFSCDQEDVVLFTETTVPGAGDTPPARQFNGLQFTRRDQRPIRPTALVLRDDGADAAYSAPEVDYAYSPENKTAVVNASVAGADAKISSSGVFGDVWTNDLRGTWSRRPRPTSCAGAVVRGDDADAPYGPSEGVSLRIEVKGDRETLWATVTDKDIQSNPIISNTDFIDMSKAVAGPGSLRVCAFANAPDTGEELMSRTAESVTVDVHTSRQLLLNPNFRPYWDVNSDSSVSSAEGEVLPGNPVYSARGWRNVTTGAGRPRYKVMPGSVLQGDDTQGFAMTGEFIAGEYVTVEQVVAVPYLDTEGSEVYLSWWFQGDGTETTFYNVTIDTLDVDGVVLDTINTTDSTGLAANTWTKVDLTLATISASARSIRVTMGVRNTTTGSPAICKASMVMGREIAENQLVNPNFNTPLSDWTTVGTAFTAETAPTNGGGIDPVDVDFGRFAQAGLTDGELYQDVAVPAAYGTGDYVRLQWWTANTAITGYGYIVLGARNGAGQLDSITVGGDPHPILDQWYYHEAYLKIPGECTTIRASINYKDDGGSGQDFLCDAMDMTFIKAGHS